MSFDERIQKLKEVQQGWVSNFRMVNIQVKLQEVDGWVRNRLRYCIWHHWYRNGVEIMTEGNNKPDKKKCSLIRLGVEQGQAFAWSRNCMGGWATSQSPILRTTITIDRLNRRGYESMSDIYERISPQLNEPLYTRPVRTVV
ncbi:group II intron maturase-specific domain-containing protein [Marinifilum fragile]|uniref:group II intron maturase-specific domain-containing protein n=1 Tax=Marinifilum fragile TaxID=570161 RepID=UPI0038B2D504